DGRLPRARRRDRPGAVPVLYRLGDPGRRRDVRRERQAVRRGSLGRRVIQLRSGGIPDRLRLLATPSPLASRADGRALYGTRPGCEVTTSLPNRPCSSSNGPAVKKSTFAGPAAAPLPKAMAHRPSIAI